MAWVKILTVCVPQHLLSPIYCLFSPWVPSAFKFVVLSDGQTHRVAVLPISNLPNHSHSRSCVLSRYRAKGKITFLIKICVTLLQSLWVTFEDHFHFPPFCGVFLFLGGGGHFLRWNSAFNDSDLFSQVFLLRPFYLGVVQDKLGKAW